MQQSQAEAMCGKLRTNLSQALREQLRVWLDDQYRRIKRQKREADKLAKALASQP